MSRQPATGNVLLLRHWILCQISRLTFDRMFYAKFCSVTFNSVVATVVLVSGSAHQAPVLAFNAAHQPQQPDVEPEREGDVAALKRP